MRQYVETKACTYRFAEVEIHASLKSVVPIFYVHVSHFYFYVYNYEWETFGLHDCISARVLSLIPVYLRTIDNSTIIHSKA